MIEERNDSIWIWLFNNNALDNKIRIEQKQQRDTKVGKYLFFSKDRNKLIDLAKKLLVEYDLYEAKVKLEDDKKTGDLVLCVYDVADDYENGGKLKQIIGKHSSKDIYYRGWKYDYQS